MRTLQLVALIVVAALVLLGVGCTSRHPPGSPYKPLTEAIRDTAEAQRLNHEAAPLIHAEPDRAEELLRRALSADLYFGLAHNNLGALYLTQVRLYEAASEFEWACKLRPAHEPLR